MQKKKDENILVRQKCKDRDNGRNKKKLQETKWRNKKKKNYTVIFIVYKYSIAFLGLAIFIRILIFEISCSFEESFHEEIDNNFELKQNLVESFFTCCVP